MKLSSTTLLLIICVTTIFLLASFYNTAMHGMSSESHIASATDVERMIRVIRIQNETIHALAGHASEGSSGHNDVNSLLKIIQEKEMQLSLLSDELQKSKQATQEAFSHKVEAAPVGDFPTSHTYSKDTSFPSSSSYALDVPPAKLQAECEAYYGMQLVDNWRAKKELWCGTDEGASMQSSLHCYPYTQHHKNSPDMFCEATNFVIDFSKISGDHGTSKPARGNQYLSFANEALASSCKKTPKYKNAYFMPHHRLQMSKFTSDVPSGSLKYDKTHDTPLYLLARDEDCENSFHSTADFMNMFLVMSILNIKPEEQQVILFDKHTDGPYFDLIHKAYSPRHKIMRHKDFHGKVLFKKLIFHLESPAGLIFPKVANPDPLRCLSTGLFQGYRKHVLNSFGLWNVPPPPIPSVTLSLRHRTPSKNVGRVMANEDDVVKVMKSINMANVQIVDTAKMPFEEQLKLIRSTNVLVGIHGAGLMFIMFAAEEAVLVEIHPSYRQDRHFRHASRMTGKIYMPLRATARETCQGSSDNVMVPIEEFKKTLDGAIRIARGFDDGISECGMQCPAGILALDKRLGDYYKPGEPRGPPVNTRFPC